MRRNLDPRRQHPKFSGTVRNSLVRLYLGSPITLSTTMSTMISPLPTGEITEMKKELSKNWSNFAERIQLSFLALLIVDASTGSSGRM